jgi:hypothetical protein
LAKGFEGGGFLFGGRGSCAGGRTCAASNAETSADAAACNAAHDTGLSDAGCTLGQIEVAGFGSDDAFACGFTQHFAASTESRSLPNTPCPASNKTTGYALDDIVANPATENTSQSRTKSCRFHAADNRTSRRSKDASALRIDAFFDKTLVEFVDAAKNGAAKQPYSCALNCTSRAARQST